MIDILLQAVEMLTAPGAIGFIVIVIIVVPVIALTIASIFGAPRTFRVPSLVIGSFVLQIGAIIFVFATFGALLGFVIPQ